MLAGGTLMLATMMELQLGGMCNHLLRRTQNKVRPVGSGQQKSSLSLRLFGKTVQESTQTLKRVVQSMLTV